MNAPLFIALAWVGFGGSHLALARPPLRNRLVRRFGPLGFAVAYSALATVMLCLLGWVQMTYGHLGPQGANLARHLPVRYALATVSIIAAMLMMAGLLAYPRSAMARMARNHRSLAGVSRPLPPPDGVFLLSRHPFFVGLILLMSAHALLAETLATALYFAGFAGLALPGLVLQDRKLAQQSASPYPAYRDVSRLLAWPSVRGIAWRSILVSAILSVLLAAGHGVTWRPANGALFAFAIAAFGNLALLGQLFRHRRRATE